MSIRNHYGTHISKNTTLAKIFYFCQKNGKLIYEIVMWWYDQHKKNLVIRIVPVCMCVHLGQTAISHIQKQKADSKKE